MTMNERGINTLIADALWELAPPNFEFLAEQHGTAKDDKTVPDILVKMPYGLRGIIELEYDLPAVEDAKAKLGYEFKDSDNLPLRSILAVGIPRDLGQSNRNPHKRKKLLKSPETQFLLQVVTGPPSQAEDAVVFPEKPLPVSLHDLVQYSWLTAIPEEYSRQEMAKTVKALDQAKENLYERLKLLKPETAAPLLKTYNPSSETGLKGAAGSIVGTLASMMQLHLCLKEWAADGLNEVLPLGHRSLWQFDNKGQRVAGLPDNLAAQWNKIKSIDYQPLSSLATAMLDDGNLSPHLGSTLRAIYETLSEFVSAGISVTTNVAAEVWQALIPDRNQRASYYTKPSTAEMLANLTTPRLKNPGQARYNEICAGTGTLARATEENLRFRHYAQTPPDSCGHKPSLHKQRMEERIRLTDINQQSISVATANMTALEPETAYDTNGIFAITAPGGALNYLNPEGVSNMLDSLIGRDGKRSDMLVLERYSADICNNNDPYFVALKGSKNPLDEKETEKYKQAADRRAKGLANGNAGLASYMHVIEHLLLAHNGVHGKVLPLKAAQADTWQQFRKNIENEYREVIVLSTAAGDGASMSADTSIQEMLLIATKKSRPERGPDEIGGDRAVTCVNLTRTFKNKVEAKMFADALRREMAKGESTGEISVGGVVGTYYRMTGLGKGKPWSALGSSGKYTTLVEEITAGKAWNPDTGRITKFGLPMTTLGQVVAKGPTHDLIGITSESLGTHPRGAFLFYPEGKKGDDIVATSNPSLWNVQSEKQSRITCIPTHYGLKRDAASPEKAEKQLAAAGHFHLSRGLSLAAGRIAVAYTAQPCMGGRSWNTLQGNEPVLKAIALFLNSAYGLIIRYGYGQKSQLGRSPVQLGAIDGHPIPNFAANTPEGEKARQIAVAEFDRLRQLELNRIALAACDKNRKEIDRVVTEILGLPWNEWKDTLQEWRKIMCQQPATHAHTQIVLDALKDCKVIPSE